MADELDKFVLQYSVELRDSIGKLEKLNEKMSGVGSSSKKSGGEVKQFASEAANELGKLVPGLNAVSTAIKSMGAEFTAATAALGALALGVKMVLNLREQYNQQRSEGMQLGVSSIRLEEYQRKFVKGSGGYLSRDQAAEGIKSFAGMANAAYADPSRLGREARLMRQYLGVDVGARGGPSTPLNTELTQLAINLKGKSRGDVQGIAKATGLNQDWLLTVQKLGPSIGKITELTGEEIEKRQQAEQSLGKFNDELSQLKEKFTELSNELAEPLLPLMTELVKAVEKLTQALPNAVHDVTKTGPVGSIASTSNDAKSHPEKGGGFIGWWRRLNGIPDADYQGAQNATNNDPNRANPRKQQKEQADKKAADQRDAAVNKLDDTSKQGIQTANEMALAINMFAGAVQSFSSAVNIQQAWAAWAGEIGKAGGLPGSSAASGTVSQVGPTAYDEYFQAAGKKYGVSVDLLKRMAQVESTMNPLAVSPTGAGGLMQITRGNQKAYGLKDYRDPATNIDTGAKIYMEALKRNNGDVAAALRAYNGNSDPMYVQKVLGTGGAGIGESKVKMQQRQVQQAIATYLGVPLSQIQRGGVNRDDAAWAASQMQNGVANNITALKQQLSVGGLPAQNYAKLQMELRDQSRGLDLLRQYSPGIVSREPAGERQRTIGERPIIININGAVDPKAVGAEVNNQLTKAMNDLLIEHANGQKG
ncbi:lytic transglycosylase domain-containing protein [Paraburkholderia fungorum]|uniref:Soluble lytic murein transglycosylase-like protein n=1 Tax=Paraburkholderia fungorum TaxID=134537 RepID=A0AAW3UYJ4_9BURK|nr:lytic transglycosylase domain-containing protein [Paraburkholderia fungorum]MBB4515845.1 soluble lytic murein transglycosylase-like protein [Paraburkholderia fungorum]MBB6203739.1 soluble lytic murein transglycosylase-like protein [Paraburkholderia fungorum]